MDLFSLIMFVLIIFWYFNRQNKSNSTDEQDDGLTDTQRRWRNMEESNQDSEAGISSEQLKYIQQNIRPFNLIEWAVYSINPRFLIRYLLSISFIFVVSIIIPWIYLGGPLVISFVIAYVIYDFFLYNSHRVMEVTEWNPEYQRKFGDKD